MPTTILELLQSASQNVIDVRFMPELLPLAEFQLKTAIDLLKKGYPLDTDTDRLLYEYGRLEDVPKNNQ